MASTDSSSGPLRFGAYQADPSAGELYKHGIRLKLQDQPFQVLMMLLERPGDVVSREELRQRLWAETTFVDFDHCLNIAMNKLREALNDSPENPRFIETLPKRGYRFIAPVERRSATAGPRTAAAGVAAAEAAASSSAQLTAARKSVHWWWVAAATMVVFAATMWMLWLGRTMPAASPLQKRVMLAVLPFDNLSGDPQHDYFIAGLTEEMIAQLGRMHASRLGVIARTSVLQYAGTRKPIAEIARELDVQYVLEGSVRREGQRVRITTQLIEVAGQTHLWAETFDRTVDDVLRVQSEVAHDVADALGMKLLPGERAAMERMPTTNHAAYEDYLKGRYFWSKRTPQDFEKALDYLKRAIEKDPEFAMAHVALADTYNLMGGYVVRGPHETFPHAKEAARKALELDPSLGAAHAALGFAAFHYDWDFPAAERHFRQAIARNPNSATARQWYAELLHAWGRLEEATREILLAEELDPLSLAVRDDAAWILVVQRRYDDALQRFASELEISPDWPHTYFSFAVAYTYMGRYDRALEELERAKALAGETIRYRQLRAAILATAGRKEEARRWLNGLLAEPAGRVPHYGLAAVYVALGEKEQALEQLELAHAAHENWLVWLKVYPEWDPLRSEPRFQTLLKKIGSR